MPATTSIENATGAGTCACGCGQRTTIQPYARRKRGLERGQPARFISGHNSRLPVAPRPPSTLGRKRPDKAATVGPLHPMWRGDQKVNDAGYNLRYVRPHPRAHRNYVRNSILIAERAFGGPLPNDAAVHHVWGDPGNDRDLVVCTKGMSNLLHRRRRAYEACGDPDARLCTYCKAYDDPRALVIRGTRVYHADCRNSDRRLRYAERHA